MLSLLKYTTQMSPHKSRCTSTHILPQAMQVGPLQGSFIHLMFLSNKEVMFCLFTFCQYLKRDFNFLTVSNAILSNILYLRPEFYIQCIEKAFTLLHLFNNLCCRFHNRYNCHFLPLNLDSITHASRTFSKN